MSRQRDVQQPDRQQPAVAAPAADVPVLAEADVVVCGGGAAGLGAALAAARAGASVVLAERWPFFGGNATAASLGSICGLYVRDGDQTDFLSGGIAREWAEALAGTGHAAGPMPYKETAVMVYSPWGYKRLADHKIRDETRITPLLHTTVYGVVKSGSDIAAVLCATKQGPRALRAKVYIDATGDADVVYHAGCPWEMGAAGRIQYPSMQFYMQGVDTGPALGGLGGLGDAMAAARREGSHQLTREHGAVIPTLRPGEYVGAMTRVARPDGTPIDATDPRDLTYAEMAGRDIAEEHARFLVDKMPGFGSSFLQDTAVTLGVRETRHAVGDHLLTFEEAAACSKFADGIAASAWPFEFHTEGDQTRWEFLPPGQWFEIPFRSVIAKGVDNLLVVGRCASAEHEALASFRVTGVCMALGEAAGLAAARCAAGDLHPRDLDVEHLRGELIASGVLRAPAP